MIICGDRQPTLNIFEKLQYMAVYNHRIQELENQFKEHVFAEPVKLYR